MQYSNLPIEKVSQVTSAHVLYEAATSEDSQAEQQNASLKLDEALLQLQQPIHGVQLLVCCHGSRDTRCGTIGNELVTVLDDLIHQRQLQDKVEVLKCSHVGGHKVRPICNCLFITEQASPAQVPARLAVTLCNCLQYAGNVLVYGPVTPCDGDWFGGVNKSNAADFFDAVINAEVFMLLTCLLQSTLVCCCLLHDSVWPTSTGYHPNHWNLLILLWSCACGSLHDASLSTSGVCSCPQQQGCGHLTDA